MTQDGGIEMLAAVIRYPVGARLEAIGIILTAEVTLFPDSGSRMEYIGIT